MFFRKLNYISSSLRLLKRDGKTPTKRRWGPLKNQGPWMLLGTSSKAGTQNLLVHQERNNQVTKFRRAYSIKLVLCRSQVCFHFRSTKLFYSFDVLSRLIFLTENLLSHWGPQLLNREWTFLIFSFYSAHEVESVGQRKLYKRYVCKASREVVCFSSSIYYTYKLY